MPHVIYDNFILENKLEDLLSTNVDIKKYLTIDNSLTTEAGMKKVINKYTASGNVEDLAMGEGNSEEITVSFKPVEYVVGTTQGKFSYYDEQAMADPKVVDMGLKGLSETMTNDFITKSIKEYMKCSDDRYIVSESTGFNDFVDAVAALNLEEESDLFGLINPKNLATLRKNLKDDLKYVEAFARSGYVGTVNGVNLHTSKAVPDDCTIVGTKEAVTAFIKKGSEIEQDRDKNKRLNSVYARKVMLIALTNETKLAVIAPPGTTPKITTEALVAGDDVDLAGTASEKAVVKVFKNDVEIGTATNTAGTWAYTIDTVEAGDVVSVKAYEYGKAPAASATADNITVTAD